LGKDTESQLNVALATTGRGDEVTDAIDLERTLFQQALIEEMHGAN